MKKNKFNLIIALSSGVVLIIFILLTKGWNGLINSFKNLDIKWLVVACLFMIIYWLLEGIILHRILHYMKESINFRDIFKVTMIGQFFNAVTPFSSGGQPAQLYYLNKNNVNAGKGASALMIKFIMFQFILTIYSLVLIIFKSAFFKSKMSNLFYLSTIGFTVNAFVIIMLLIFSTYKNLTHKIITYIYKVVLKFKKVKDPEKLKNSIDSNLHEFHENIKLMKENMNLVLENTIYTIIQLTVFFSIPYFIHKSFAIGKIDIINIIAANAFVLMITSFIPLPGASGGAEGGFYMFFKLFFNETYIMTAILLWRLITFYSCIIFGAIAMMRTSEPKEIFSRG